jgi:hypothetical protein
LPDGLIQNAMALTVDVTFHTTAGGVILGYQDAPGGNVPGNYVPALYVGTDGKLYGTVYSLGAVHSNTVVNDGLSHHAVLSVVGSTLSLTLDGVLLGQTTGSLSPLNMKFDQLGTGYTVNYPAGVNGGADPFIGTLEKVLITTNGAPAASETVPSGSASQALQLNGTNQYVDLGNPADLNFRGPITLEAWIKPMSSGGLQDIITHGYQTSPYQAEVYLRIANGTYQVGSWNGTDSTATAAMPASDLGQWVHLAGVYDGTHWQLYRNGVLVASSAPTTQGALLVSSTDWAIGARGTGTERFFQGSIADVSIWRVGRSAAQVQSDMRSGLTGTEAGLAAYYRFAETNGVTAADATGNNNNGILGGANPAQAPTRLAGTVLGSTALAFSPTTAGTYAVSIQVIQPDGGTGVASGSVTVVARAPTGVDIHGQPSNGVVGPALGGPITVAVVDAYGNTVTTSTAPVTLALASGPAGAQLSGTTTVHAVNGVATFRDLRVNVAGTYTLKATGGTLTPDISNPFTVAPADVTAGLTLQRGSLQAMGSGPSATLQFEQTVTLCNSSGHVLSGPLAVVFNSLPSGVTLANATGTYQGHLYLDVLGSGASLAPGQRLTLTLKFSRPSQQVCEDILYTLKVLEGI